MSAECRSSSLALWGHRKVQMEVRLEVRLEVRMEVRTWVRVEIPLRYASSAERTAEVIQEVKAGSSCRRQHVHTGGGELWDEPCGSVKPCRGSLAKSRRTYFKFCQCIHSQCCAKYPPNSDFSLKKNKNQKTHFLTPETIKKKKHTQKI